jgi:hypothetical protein
VFVRNGEKLGSVVAEPKAEVSEPAEPEPKPAEPEPEPAKPKPTPVKASPKINPATFFNDEGESS